MSWVKLILLREDHVAYRDPQLVGIVIQIVKPRAAFWPKVDTVGGHRTAGSASVPDRIPEAVERPERKPCYPQILSKSGLNPCSRRLALKGRQCLIPFDEGIRLTIIVEYNADDNEIRVQIRSFCFPEEGEFL